MAATRGSQDPTMELRARDMNMAKKRKLNSCGGYMMFIAVGYTLEKRSLIGL